MGRTGARFPSAQLQEALEGAEKPDVAEQASEPPAPVEEHEDAVIVDAEAPAEAGGPQAAEEPAATPAEPPAETPAGEAVEAAAAAGPSADTGPSADEPPQEASESGGDDAVIESAKSGEAPSEAPEEPAEAAEAEGAEAVFMEPAEPLAAEAEPVRDAAPAPAPAPVEPVEPVEAAGDITPPDSGGEDAGRGSLFGGVVAYDTDAELDEATLDDVRSWVRPYVWTGGRTDTTLEFELETLVSARKQEAADEDPDQMRDEHRRVLDLCDQPRSVTEIAALLSVPLGVAKTLLGVMAEENMLVVHSNGDTSGIGPDLQLMERVLRGLRKL